MLNPPQPWTPANAPPTTPHQRLPRLAKTGGKAWRRGPGGAGTPGPGGAAQAHGKANVGWLA